MTAYTPRHVLWRDTPCRYAARLPARGLPPHRLRRRFAAQHGAENRRLRFNVTMLCNRGVGFEVFIKIGQAKRVSARRANVAGRRWATGEPRSGCPQACPVGRTVVHGRTRVPWLRLCLTAFTVYKNRYPQRIRGRKIVEKGSRKKYLDFLLEIKGLQMAGGMLSRCIGISSRWRGMLSR